MSYTSSDGRRFSDDGELLSDDYVPSSENDENTTHPGCEERTRPACMTCGSTLCRGCNGLPIWYRQK